MNANVSPAPTRRVVVLGTGGTIAGRATQAGDNVGYTAAQVGVEALVRDLGLAPDVVLLTEQVAQLDSKDMHVDAWRALAGRCAHWLAQPGVAGIVITHGTDTLEESAFFLRQALHASRPVVLTCAMRPATALVPDGPQNLSDAIAVALTPGARGVVAVCAGRVHAAVDLRKVHTYRLDAFSSGDAGVLGHVEQGAVRQVRDWPAPPPAAQADALRARALAAARWPRVEIVASHAGADGALVDLLVAQRRADPAAGVAGLVIAATGNGTVHAQLERAARDARAAGIAVRRATRCAEGRIVEGGAPDDQALASAGGLSPVQARIALQLELLGPLDRPGPSDRG